MPDPTPDTCPTCNGSGSSNPAHHNERPSNAPDIIGWSPCPACGGSGHARPAAGSSSPEPDDTPRKVARRLRRQARYMEPRTLHPGYLADAIEHARVDEVTLRSGGPMRPVWIEAPGYVAVVMPVKVVGG